MVVEQPYVVNIEDALWYSGSCTNGVSIAKRKKHEASHGLFWATIILIIITMSLGIILPWGPISSLLELVKI